MFKNEKVNPDHVYELFGNFNGLSAKEVRMHLLEYMMKECSVRLLYLGNLKFGTLHWQPCNPQPVKPKLGQFKIIKEFTLDKPTTSGESSTPDNESEEHVETMIQSESAPPSVNSEGTDTPSDFTQPIEKPVQETIENIPADVESMIVTNTVKVETLVWDDSEIKSSEAIPNLKDLKVVVHKLDDLVKDDSTGTVNSPVETELKPIITSVRGYNLRSTQLHEGDTDNNDDEPKQKKPKGAHPSRSGPSPERLLAHANALINKVSSFVSKPSNEPSDDGIVSNVEASSQINDQILPVETSNSTPVCNKPARTIRCKICIDSFGSIKELNEHHRKDHRIVDCEQCAQKFATQSSLDKHMYLHNDLRFVCEDCGQSFPFKSRLEQHQITHQTELSFMCKHKGCSGGFKNKGDFNRHMHSHEDVWFKCNCCLYKNKDKRNRDSHMRTHQEKGIGLERYHCECCGKVMWFSTQLKCHRVTECDVLDLHVETSKGDSKTP